MKAILISIKPKWCELIASGKKTVEVRKTKPKLETPFKVYIYCTKGETVYLPRDVMGNEALNGKVIGEFVCRQTYESGWILSPDHPDWEDGFDDESCLTDRELYEYSNGGTFYGWHISDPVIYDEPIELWEFYREGNPNDRFYDDYCSGCPHHETPISEFPCNKCHGNRNYLYSPPQTWCYVEELEDRR